MPARGTSRARPEADELPGAHAPLRQPAPELPRPAAPLRRVVDAPPQRADGHAARAAPRPARDAGRRAHLLHARADRGGDLRLPRLRRVPLRPLRHGGALRALHAAGEQARHGRGVGLHGGGARAALERRNIDYYVGEGEGAFYGPKIDLHMLDVARPLVADGDDPARRADAEAVRAHLHGRGQRRAHAVRRPPRAARLAGAIHRES